MKSIQVVSGFLLSLSLLTSSENNAQAAEFNDGGFHVISDGSFSNEPITVRNGTTLQFEEGAVVGTDGFFSGLITVMDTSVLEINGGTFGASGYSSAFILVQDNAKMTVRGGVFGSSGPYSGQIACGGQSTLHISGGRFGGTGVGSGSLLTLDASTVSIEGGFGVEAMGSVMLNDSSMVEVIGSDFNLPTGQVADPSGVVTGLYPDENPFQIAFSKSFDSILSLINAAPADTDGDGISDDEDMCPESDLRSTVWIGDWNTHIPNQINGMSVDALGCSLADLIQGILVEAADSSSSHGQFIRKVVHGLGELRRDGLLEPYHHGRIISLCAHRR